MIALDALRASLRRRSDSDVLAALRVQVLALAGYRPGEIRGRLGMSRHEYSKTHRRLREALDEAAGGP